MTDQKLDREPVVEADLPPLPPPDASDAERHRALMNRTMARFGTPSLEDYQRVYAQAGLDWPGEDEIRRRHPVADPAA